MRETNAPCRRDTSETTAIVNGGGVMQISDW
jgi:hypothetical protein